MKLAKSLLLASAAAFAAVAGAQAADLPSRKSAPVNYVKICDAYGAGFFYIPGTDTCLKVGGYVRAVWQYTPGRNVFTVAQAGANLNYVPAVGFPISSPTQVRGSQDTTGTEVRGRIDLDARTPTALGTVRTAVRLRAANTSGIRNSTAVNNANIGLGTGSATAISIEQAFVQWAGFTFGVAPENYAMMPGIMYGGQAWAGFPNGIKQLAYTATFGGGFSATLAIEERTEFGYSPVYNHTPANGYHLVGNIRVDQSWGFAALHGMVGNNSIRSGFTVLNGLPQTPALAGNNGVANNPLFGSSSTAGWAIGATAKFNLPMIAAGDALYLTANYTRGLLGAVLGGGSLNSISVAAQHRFLGGIQRIDSPLVVTNGNCTAIGGCSIGSTTGWNVAGLLTHYWMPQLRSNISAAYVQISPPTVSALAASPFQWGKGTLWQVGASLIYSPAKDFDIGLELQYANVKNRIQNIGLITNLGNYGTGLGQTARGLSDNNISAIFRVERQF